MDTPQAAREAIARDLAQLGVAPGDVLLVHSSLSALGFVPGGAQTVIAALRDALGADGTLLTPALSYRYVTRDMPQFHVTQTPSNVGLIPETFRQMDGVRRSVHPTHSVCALGKLAEALLADHAVDDTPCGSHSPFHRLPKVGGKILMLGCGLKPNTSMHAVEEVYRPPYLFGSPIEYQITDARGRTYRKVYTPHGFGSWRQRYDRIVQVEAVGLVKTGAVLKATAHLIDAPLLWANAESCFAKDAYFFVERIVGQ